MMQRYIRHPCVDSVDILSTRVDIVDILSTRVLLSANLHIRHIAAALVDHKVVEEDILGDAEPGAAGQQLVPHLAPRPALQLPGDIQIHGDLHNTSPDLRDTHGSLSLRKPVMK